MQANELKKCSRCGFTKRADEFPRNSRANSGYDYTCKQCQKARHLKYALNNKEKMKIHSREYYKKKRAGIDQSKPLLPIEERKLRDKEMARWRDMKRKYGISREEFTALWENQNGKCLTCGVELTLTKAGYTIDHDHTTGKVRGLLCRMCNRVIGMLKDSPEIFHSIAGYLESNE